MPRAGAWIGAIAASAAAAIAVRLAAPDAHAAYGVLKAATTALIIAWAMTRRPSSAHTDGAHEVARWRALLVGLVLSWVGDVALLWPREGFLPGLVAFLLAHLAYGWAFTRGVRPASPPWPFAVYAALAAGVLALLWPGVPAGLRVPVAAYVAALAAMAAQTACFALARRAWPAAAGGALFLLSDALLAWDRFHTPLPAASLWILGPYWAAQTLLAASLPARRSGH